MKPPDKLYVSQLIYETWQYQTPDPDDETQVEYIRKEALLEWAKEKYEEHTISTCRNNPYDMGGASVADELIDKINSL